MTRSYYWPFKYRLHVIDTDPTSAAASGWLDDTSLVEKYTISEEDYEKRDASLFLSSVLLRYHAQHSNAGRIACIVASFFSACSVEGKKVFHCERNYGSFLRPDKVKIGEYPERDPFDDDEPDEF
ncbi:unnamed protein product [Closterium sp. Yama58-4]|nr:unnamed protein product [Closterium sp. Yama58-4]